MWRTRYYYQILWKMQLAQKFEKYSTMKLIENLSSGVDLFNANGRRDGQTDIHT